MSQRIVSARGALLYLLSLSRLLSFCCHDNLTVSEKSFSFRDALWGKGRCWGPLISWENLSRNAGIKYVLWSTQSHVASPRYWCEREEMYELGRRCCLLTHSINWYISSSIYQLYDHWTVSLEMIRQDYYHYRLPPYLGSYAVFSTISNSCYGIFWLLVWKENARWAVVAAEAKQVDIWRGGEPATDQLHWTLQAILSCF